MGSRRSRVQYDGESFRLRRPGREVWLEMQRSAQPSVLTNEHMDRAFDGTRLYDVVTEPYETMGALQLLHLKQERIDLLGRVGLDSQEHARTPADGHVSPIEHRHLRAVLPVGELSDIARNGGWLHACGGGFARRRRTAGGLLFNTFLARNGYRARPGARFVVFARCQRREQRRANRVRQSAAARDVVGMDPPSGGVWGHARPTRVRRVQKPPRVLSIQQSERINNEYGGREN